ncbi:MAG TPA: chemotaxis protein CheW [Symbiobacteriaceae bacterium]
METVRVEQQVVIFRVGEGTFALGIDAVREVVPWSPPSPLPDAPPAVEGVLDLRGEVFPVVELARLLGTRRSLPDPEARILIVNLEGQQAGLVVDEVTDVLTVTQEMITPTSQLLAARSASTTAGILRLGEGRLVVLLDPARILAGMGISGG